MLRPTPGTLLAWIATQPALYLADHDGTWYAYAYTRKGGQGQTLPLEYATGDTPELALAALRRAVELG